MTTPHQPGWAAPETDPASTNPTQPLWYGDTRGHTPAGSATGGGGPAYGTGTAGYPPVPGSPIHPAEPYSPVGRQGSAELARPAKPRRRLLELTTVAALAAALASGTTYAVTRTDAPATSAASSAAAAQRNAPPVVQAAANAPDWTATAAAVSPSVVAISVRGMQGGGQGSGVILDDAGHVVTNNHVVSGAGSGSELGVTLNDSRTYAARIVGTDPSTDLAVIKITDPPDDLRPIAMGDADALRVGDPVMAVGNPLGLAGTVTTGIVSALNRPVTTQAQDPEADPFGQASGGEPVVTNAVQTSAAINPGNSGGALVNASGQLVGINSSIASLGSSAGGQSGNIGIGFAIPVNEAKSIADQLIRTGRAEHAYLGVRSQDGAVPDGSARRAAAVVTSVIPNTPAAQAGLQDGDAIIAVDQEPIDGWLSLVAQIRERTVGDEATLTVVRDGERREVSVTLTRKPTSP